MKSQVTKSVDRMLLGLFVLVGDVKSKLVREEGATAVEYGLLVALIAAVIIATVVVLGKQIRGAFCTIVINLEGVCP